MMIRNTLITLAILGLSLPLTSAQKESQPPCSPLLNHTLTDIDQKPQNLCQYQGKVILAVNTASQCGYTPQYKDLQAAYQKYKDQGLVVLGFPANQFGKQEPGKDKEIKSFCEDNYKVNFPLFSKTTVLGKSANPFYKGLISETKKEPLWNFHKFLIDRSGTKVLSFESGVKPQDKPLKMAIERYLSLK